MAGKNGLEYSRTCTTGSRFAREIVRGCRAVGRARGDDVAVAGRLRLALDLLAPHRAHAALTGDRGGAARHELFLVEDGVDAAVGRLGVVERVHADGVARAGLGAQAADHT